LKTHSYTETNHTLLAKYRSAENEELSVKDLVKKMESEIAQLEQLSIACVSEMKKSRDTLMEIALKPSSASTVDYLDVLIENEKRDMSVGWKDRMAFYEKGKIQAALIDQCTLNPQDMMAKIKAGRQ